MNDWVALNSHFYFFKLRQTIWLLNQTALEIWNLKANKSIHIKVSYITVFQCFQAAFISHEDNGRIGNERRLCLWRFGVCALQWWFFAVALQRRGAEVVQNLGHFLSQVLPPRLLLPLLSQPMRKLSPGQETSSHQPSEIQAGEAADGNSEWATNRIFRELWTEKT